MGLDQRWGDEVVREEIFRSLSDKELSNSIFLRDAMKGASRRTQHHDAARFSIKIVDGDFLSWKLWTSCDSAGL